MERKASTKYVTTFCIKLRVEFKIFKRRTKSENPREIRWDICIAGLLKVNKDRRD